MTAIRTGVVMINDSKLRDQFTRINAGIDRAYPRSYPREPAQQALKTVSSSVEKIVELLLDYIDDLEKRVQDLEGQR